MAGPNNRAGYGCERSSRRIVLHHNAQVESDGGGDTIFECGSWAAGIFHGEDVEWVCVEVGNMDDSFHQAGEYRHSDLCRRLLLHCLQR